MKKFYLLIVLWLVAGGSLHAQSFSYQNATLYLQGDGSTILEGTVDIYNISAVDLGVKVARTNNNLAPNHLSYFCWGTQCYGPLTDTSQTTETIPAGTFNNTFKGDLNPGFSMGLSRVTYCFFDVNNPGDSVCMEFVYDITTGIDEVNKAENFVSAPTPNPADAFTSISYHLAKPASDIRLVIRNIIGSEVSQLKLNSQQKIMMLNTSSLKQGVYFYSIIADNKVINTNRLVVSHRN